QDGLISQQATDDAKGQLQTAQATLDAARAQVGVAEAEVEQASASLQSARLAQDSATIRAPWSGIVVSRSLDPGAYVTTSGGTPILSIADLDNVAVLVNVTEADMGVLRRGAKAEIGVDAFPNRMFHGTVARIAGGVDPDSRTVQVEVELNNSDHALRPGMYARVRLAGAARRAFVVPLSALVIVGGQKFVWVVADGKVSQRAVTIGTTTASVVEITSGVKPGETIVFRRPEQAMTRVAGVQQLNSTSRRGSSMVQVWFDWGADLNVAEVEIIQNIQRIARSLPDGVSQPAVLKFDISNIPVAQVVVAAPGMDA